VAVIFDGKAAEVQGLCDLLGRFLFPYELQDAEFRIAEEGVGLEEGFAGLAVGLDAADHELYSGEQLHFVDGFDEIVGGVGGGGLFDDGAGLVGGDEDDLEGVAAAQLADQVDAGEFFLQVNIAEQEVGQHFGHGRSRLGGGHGDTGTAGEVGLELPFDETGDNNFVFYDQNSYHGIRREW